MAHVENHTTSGIAFYFSEFNSVLLVPGVNIVPDIVLPHLHKHPSFKHYQETGQLTQRDYTAEPLFDEKASLHIDATGDEKTPVVNAVINNTVTPIGTDKAIKLTLTGLRKAGITPDVAQNLIKMSPAEGWTGLEQLRQSMPEMEETDLDKLKTLF